jgi:hypothetical protein
MFFQQGLSFAIAGDEELRGERRARRGEGNVCTCARAVGPTEVGSRPTVVVRRIRRLDCRGRASHRHGDSQPTAVGGKPWHIPPLRLPRPIRPIDYPQIAVVRLLSPFDLPWFPSLSYPTTTLFSTGTPVPLFGARRLRTVPSEGGWTLHALVNRFLPPTLEERTNEHPSLGDNLTPELRSLPTPTSRLALETAGGVGSACC